MQPEILNLILKKAKYQIDTLKEYECIYFNILCKERSIKKTFNWENREELEQKHQNTKIEIDIKFKIIRKN